MTNANKGSARGGRPLTGRVVKLKSGPHAGQLQGIVTLVDGTTQRLPPFPKGTSLARAKDSTVAKQEAARAAGITKPIPKGVAPKGGGEEWWEGYLAHRDSKGLSPVRHLYRPHIQPVVGTIHPKDLTRQDCERLVSELDRKISTEGDGQISWKTAANVWSLFTKACKVACSTKAPAGLRARDDNPCAGVEAPERGENKLKQWLYPTEAAKLLACSEVPLRWRQLFAMLAYTYLRPGELKVLEWTDVSFEMGTIHVTKAWDEKRARIKPPKTRAGVRHVPIEPELVPLLRALQAVSRGQGRVIQSMPPMEDWAAKFRRYLHRAGVDRAELFIDSETHKQITLYDLRATGITWRCIRRDYGPAIQEAAGHEKYDTTDGYIRAAQVFIGRVGTPFPSLPLALTEGSDQEFRSSPLQVAEIVVTPAGIEPALPA